MEEKIRTKAPGQAQREDPDAGDPHADMVVQPARLLQFRHPGVEADDAGRARDRAFMGVAQAAIGRERRAVARELRAVGVPDAGAQFQPALPVAAPEHFLDELLRGLRAVIRQRGADQLGFRHQAMAHRRRQQGDIGTPAEAGVAVAPCGVARAHPGCEGDEAGERVGAGGGEGLGHHRPPDRGAARSRNHARAIGT
jgi:hypothetical protein